MDLRRHCRPDGSVESTLTPSLPPFDVDSIFSLRIRTRI